MTEEQKKQIIEDLTRFNWDSTHSGGWSWTELTNSDSLSDKRIATHWRKTAKSQIIFLQSHGLDIPEKYVEARIPKNLHQKIRDFKNELGLPEETTNPNWEAYNQAILDIKAHNPNGLYTKEVSHD